MSYIQMCRHELIWESRMVTWDERDWEDFKQRYEAASKKDESIFAKAAMEVYSVIKDMTFNEAIAECQKLKEGKGLLIKVTKYNWDGRKYIVPLADLILDDMREDCYNADVYDTNYANEYEENVEYHIDDPHFGDNPDDLAY